MKNFNDLIFNPHSIAEYPDFSEAKQAVEKFNNGYSVSVLSGKPFYSNGIDTYELAVIYSGNIVKVIGNLSAKKITEIMERIQNEP